MVHVYQPSILPSLSANTTDLSQGFGIALSRRTSCAYICSGLCLSLCSRSHCLNATKLYLFNEYYIIILTHTYTHTDTCIRTHTYAELEQQIYTPNTSMNKSMPVHTYLDQTDT